jgi:hypothetical protein
MVDPRPQSQLQTVGFDPKGMMIAIVGTAVLFWPLEKALTIVAHFFQRRLRGTNH